MATAPPARPGSAGRNPGMKSAVPEIGDAERMADQNEGGALDRVRPNQGGDGSKRPPQHTLEGTPA